MVKKILVLIFLLAPFVFVSSASASLVTVEEDGEVVVNVLSAEDGVELEIADSGDIEVTQVADGDVEGKGKVTLGKVGEELVLNISTDSGVKRLDVTDYDRSLIEVERRSNVERMTISAVNDSFLIRQRGVIVKTDYEISIDPEDAGLTLKTPTGYKYVSITPKEAVDTMLRSKLISRIAFDNSVELKETDQELSYEIRGDKIFNILSLFEYKIPVRTKVSASTGEIVSVDEPDWLGKIVNVLLV